MMNYGQINGIDKPVSRLVQGVLMLPPDDDAVAFAALDAFMELGVNTFDTAHVYGSGSNERMLGRWVNARGNRDQVVIITKGAHHNADRRRVTPYDITADLMDSLARLKLDTIDLYLLHRDDPLYPVGPIVEVLNEHQAEGRIRAFGGSNWSHERLQQAADYAQEHFLNTFAVSSPQYSLAEMFEPPWENCVSIGGHGGEAARAWYGETTMPLFTWSSLAGGFFSGRFRRDNLDSFTAYLDKLCVTSYCYEPNFQRLDRAEQMAREKGLTLPQIALAYVMSTPLDIYALVGSGSADELAANIAALNTPLTSDEMAYLDLRDSTTQ